jgi:vacuolar protein-sorting-associated protein 4
VKLLFESARKRTPAVIFIDEIEALCGKRGEDSNNGSDRVKTEFLVQMDGVGNDLNGVVVLGATNLPWQLDAAIRRRFQRRIHIGLPDLKARARTFQIHMGEMGVNLASDDYDRLAAMSEGFSGSDISNAVQDALMIPVRKIYKATHYYNVSATFRNLFEPFIAFAHTLTPMNLLHWTYIFSFRSSKMERRSFLPATQHIQGLWLWIGEEYLHINCSSLHY